MVLPNAERLRQSDSLLPAGFTPESFEFLVETIAQRVAEKIASPVVGLIAEVQFDSELPEQEQAIAELTEVVEELVADTPALQLPDSSAEPALQEAEAILGLTETQSTEAASPRRAARSRQ